VIIRQTMAQQRAKNKYNAKTYDQLKVWIRKGGRSVVQGLAAAAGMSTAEYLRHLIVQDAAQHGLDVRDALGGGVTVPDVLDELADCIDWGGWV